MNRRALSIWLCLLFIGHFSVAWKYTIPPLSHSLVKFDSGLFFKQQLKNEFSMTVWNIHKGKGGQAWVNDMKLLSNYSDVLLLQE